MKALASTYFLTLSLLLFPVGAYAHSPEEHAKVAEEPDCATIKKMDHSKMDMNDPVTQAMHKRCKQQMGHGSDHSQGSIDKAEDEKK